MPRSACHTLRWKSVPASSSSSSNAVRSPRKYCPSCSAAPESESGSWSARSSCGAVPGKYRWRSDPSGPPISVSFPIGLSKFVNGMVDSASSAGIVEDNPERDALAGGHSAHPVAESDAVVAVAARVRALAGGEDHERALWRAQHVRATLGARALLEQHELTAGIVALRIGQHGEHLEREIDLAVEI